MQIHRSRPESGWAQIPNDTLRDPRLSYRARGVLAEVLSRPDDWATTADEISRRARENRGDGGEGRDQVRAAFAELEHARYLYRERRRGGRGRFVTVLHVFDVPVADPAALLAAERRLAASVDKSLSGNVSAGRTGDDRASRRPGLGKRVSPQVGPATGPPGVGPPGVGPPGVGPPGVGPPGVFTKTDYEDQRTKTGDEDQGDEDQARSLTSPVPVEGEEARSGQDRFSDEEWAERERIVSRQVGPLPAAAT